MSGDKNIERIIRLLKRSIKLRDFRRSSPFAILISTILSQRTRDENTERAFRKLFSRYKTPAQLAHAPQAEIQRLIGNVGFYRVKAKRIKEVSKIIMGKHSGRVPGNINDLLSLPGVGRKTANCVLVFGFGKEAIPVDTHVHRISNRLGIVSTKKPDETEKKLRERVPKKFWRDLNSLFVEFGQSVCKPLKPECAGCPVSKHCDSKDVSLPHYHSLLRKQERTSLALTSL